MSHVSDRTSGLRIAGFGACMISGYPHKDGMLEAACCLIERALSRPVRSTIVSLHSFPAPRAEKYLERRVLSFDPDYVVLQFGSTDAACPVQSVHRAASGLSRTISSAPPASYHRRPSTILNQCRWELSSLMGYLSRPAAISPQVAYTAAIERMVKGCRAVGVEPVVLSPFVYGSRYATTNAIAYTKALRKLADAIDFIFIDCINILKRQPLRQILEHDGFHLTLLGHELVGHAIAESIVTDFIKRVEIRNSAA